jgi:quercetin dioxygenase-like cupin family protein
MTDVASTSADIVALSPVANELLVQAREHQSRPASRTVVSGQLQRATVIALAKGTELAEHDSPPAATLQVITGRVRLHSGEREWLMESGDVVPIPPTRHGLVALTDAAVLLTVALR